MWVGWGEGGGVGRGRGWGRGRGGGGVCPWGGAMNFMNFIYILPSLLEQNILPNDMIGVF